MVNWYETGVPLEPPTRQERRVIFLLINGITTNAEIAEWLYITPETAGQHVDHLRDKFGAKTRAELVAHIFHSILISLLVEVPDYLQEPSVHQNV